MKKSCLAVLLVLFALNAPGQDQALTLDDLMDSAQQWANENLDDQALALLGELDREKVKQVFTNIQHQLRGEYVIDLASLRDSARSILPLLEAYEETQPYAAWLKPRLDYLDVAEQFRVTTPPPRTTPGQSPPPLPNPAPKAERDAWTRKLADRPWPEAAKAYVPRLKPIFAGQKVPPELVWLAEVESSFDRRARSPVGAAGLFQLMPATAKRYGLRTWPLDQRFRPEESARAAAQYLDFLHRDFKDWRLALAAYNAGEGTVHRLLKQHNARTFDAVATHLPAETQMYVPRIEATLLRREGVRLADLRVPAG